jgi:hypothetical protein
MTGGSARDKSDSREVLRDAGVAYIASMVQRVSLRQLAVNYPHVVNRLAYLPLDSDRIKYLDSLILDDRPNRGGFSLAALQEINALHADLTKHLSRQSNRR